MLMYPLEEAIDLLSGKLAAAQKSQDETIEDLEWLREQITVMEVNFARVHNVSSPFFARRGLLIPSACSGMLRDGEKRDRSLSSPVFFLLARGMTKTTLKTNGTKYVMMDQYNL